MRFLIFIAAMAAGLMPSPALSQADNPLLVPPGVTRPAAVQPKGVVSPVLNSPVLSDPDYRLGAADKVRVIVFNEASLSGEFYVNASGMLSLPLIGDVKAGDRTTSDVIKDIQGKLADGYLSNPRVSIDVLTYRPFYILGEVAKPGEYAYSNKLSAMMAVATAQGFTYRANKRAVFIKRDGEHQERRYKLEPDLMIYPGDTVRIGERHL